MPEQHLLVVGRGALATGVAHALDANGVTVQRLRDPIDRELRRALATRPQGVVIFDRSDVSALRTALLVEHLSPGIHLTVTIFDRTVAEQVRATVPNVLVSSMADAALGAVLGPCVADGLIALHPRSGNAVRSVDGLPELVHLDAVAVSRRRPTRRWIARQLRPHDRASRLLVASLTGLLALLAVDVALTLAVHGGSVVGELYNATKALAAVNSNPVVDEGPEWLRLYASAAILAAVALFAVFTAALVSRLGGSGLTTTVGARTIPRSDHVVVGLGQVGFRLCIELQALGVDVVAVERDPESAYVRLARARNVPVVIARGGDRFVLERLALPKARALAAVTSDELENISVAVTALAVQEHLRIVMRAGSNEITEETAALFPVGVACDVLAVAAAALAASALERQPVRASRTTARSTSSARTRGSSPSAPSPWESPRMGLNRDLFPGLQDGWARFDAPGGTQPLGPAIEAGRAYSAGGTFANYGGTFPASVATRAVTDGARASVGGLLGADPEGVVFGPSMTALTFRFAEAVGRGLGPGDELVVTRLDHDANVRPWELAAERSGATLRVVDPDATLTLTPACFDAVLNERTRWVAFTAASNVVGSLTDVAAVTALAHAVGARVFVDAVHAAPHVPVDVAALGCDALVCSAYKWFGPHLGVLVAAPELLAELPIDKLRASSDAGADRWDQGTQPFELLATAGAAADYVVETGWGAIATHEAALREALHGGLRVLDHVTIVGSPERRTPTALFAVDGVAPAAVAEALACDRIAVGAGSFYAIHLAELLDAPEGWVRAGCAHYTSLEEVGRLVAGVAALR